MKDHREYEKKIIGGSDIASLTYRTPQKAGILNFGGDGVYMAYVVDAECEIPKYYELTAESIATDGWGTWLKLYDDSGLAEEFRSEKGIKIYQAGGYGCIIQIL